MSSAASITSPSLAAAAPPAVEHVDPARVVFPHAVVESNEMIPMPARRDLHRCAAFEHL